MSETTYTPELISRQAAKARGLTRFYTGRPCAQGHTAERYVSGNCVACSAAHASKRIARLRESDPERRRDEVRLSVQRHYDKHRAEILARKKLYYVQNAEAIKAKSKERGQQIRRDAKAHVRAVSTAST